MTNKSDLLKIIAINYFPFTYILIGVALFYYFGDVVQNIIFILFWLYILPPMLCRLVLLIFHRPEGVFSEHDKEFYIWWFLAQLQLIYNRFPFLEEALRLIPGVYNIWLNMWGSKIHLTVFWSPGIHIFDRYDLNIARGAVVGGGCRIGAHIFDKEKNGSIKLLVAPVVIGENVLLGLNSLVGPGCYISDNETLVAGKVLKPFCTLKDGHITRPER